MQVDLPYELKLIATLSGHEDRAWHLAWNPTKPLLASCSGDRSVRLYSYSPSALDFRLAASIPTGHTKSVRAVAWAPSGKTLVTASFDANIGVWEREEDDEDGAGEWECLTLLEGHETECKSVAYSSTGTLLASCSRDKSVWVWEVQPDADFECLGVMMEHTQDVKCVAWHPTEELLASASYDDTIRFYIDDPSDDWYCAATIQAHESTVWSLAWSPDGRFLASASDDKTVKIWKRTGQFQFKEVLVLTGHERAVFSLAWGKGKGGARSLGWLASTGSDGIIFVRELQEAEDTVTERLLTKVHDAHGVHDINTVAWCPTTGLEDILGSAGDDGNCKIWRIEPTGV
ncbi:WD40 repeat-like protein [Cylindrobasidium torrendii FP15055 ss-10]|uniref:Probable cytosolic iron-sulfur protein assembly protein 1 n=1 Tax=Cylindrobasidium torrendii FP15055 ss-10 TaxID=1314674 RepID=A0A0D7BF23_9AGAR|nr:WD40 repeat-like protein [Cylindrobasidium torrendii FP15055 ss-10]